MIVFGSRGSDLALTQSRAVAEEVKRRTGEDYRIDVMQTAGDRIQDKPLSGIGIKGLFTSELEDALRSGAIDAAVHSLKDLPVEDPDGLTLGAIPPRERAADVLVARPDAAGQDFPSQGFTGQDFPRQGFTGQGDDLLRLLAPGTRIGTSSPRRALAAATLRRDLEIADIRGNVPTRVDKARRGDYGAVVLAAAGLRRLGLDLRDLRTQELPVEHFTPAPGQGALGVQCRRDDARVQAALRSVHCETTASCANQERAVLLGLGGGCSMPLGVLITPVGDRFRLLASLFAGNGPCALQTAAIGGDPAALAQAVVDAWHPLVGEPLQGLRAAIVRPDGERTGLAAALAIAGAQTDVLAWTRTEPIVATEDELQAAVAGDALAFTSARAVREFTQRCAEQEVTPFDARAFAVGASTASELVRSGFHDVTTADGRGGAALAAVLQQAGVAADAKLTFPCAEARHDGFEAAARAAGFAPTPLPLYRLVEQPDGQLTHDVDAFVFTSPSAVRAFCSRRHDAAIGRAVAIGRTTAEALREHHDGPTRVLDVPTPAALVDALRT